MAQKGFVCIVKKDLFTQQEVGEWERTAEVTDVPYTAVIEVTPDDFVYDVDYTYVDVKK